MFPYRFSYLLLRCRNTRRPQFCAINNIHMKRLLQLEELMMTALGIAALHYQPVPVSWWAWPVLFLSPDIAMLGYMVNTKVGAFTYNLFHHKAVAILLAAAGFLMHDSILQLAGIVLFAHSAFDRMLGFGLKYNDGFRHTHLEAATVPLK